jgi:hypothetical protein
MSFLYPLFFAGIAVVTVPIILHMIRRHTRKRVTFSSLLFLRTTAPRFKNRKKLEDILLLILRCTILILLAAAFSRPFLRQSEQNNIPDNSGRRVVILVDTSASMRRAGLWEQAISQAQAAMNDIEPADRLCVMSFDKEARPLLGFDLWSQTEPQLRLSSAKQALSTLSPGWGATSTGNALVTAAEAIEDDEINIKTPVTKRQIILISDMQQGSDFDALHNYLWPEGMEVIVKTIRSKEKTNAAMQLLTKSDYMLQANDKGELSIRIINSADASAEHFQLKLASDKSTNPRSAPVDIYVPAGGSIVTTVPAESNNITSGTLTLTGDNGDFDNTLYLAPKLKQQANILYLGNDDVNNPQQMFYYLKRVFQQTNIFKPGIVTRPASNVIPETDISSAQLIIITDAVKPESIELLRRQLQGGNMILLAMKSANISATLAGLAGLENIKADEANVQDYTMLSQIEFEHPLLAVFSEPRFRDFSKIHFWNYRRVYIDDMPDAHILARFDNNDPALFELPVGKGTLLVLTSGWQPSDSQLALSSKFVPLFYSLLEYQSAFDSRQLQYYVGDDIRIPQAIVSQKKELTIRSPDGSQTRLEPEQQIYKQAKMPGIYRIETSDSKSNQLFAVNLPLRESRTAALSLDELEQYGNAFGNSPTASAVVQNKLSKKFSSLTEMENSQKLWRWLFALIFAVLMIETLLAGVATRPAKAVQEKTNETYN